MHYFDGRPITPEQFQLILEKHKKWLNNEEGGERADLRYADLRSADLRYADLSYADLRSANLRSADLRSANLRSADLRSADLRYADLSSADLRSADLRYADLRYADLSSAKNCMYATFLLLPDEVAALRQAVIDGKIDGSKYSGECACLKGTLAQARGLNAQRYNGWTCNVDQPSEALFTNIRPGDTPENNAVSKLVLEWIDEWFKLPMAAAYFASKPVSESDVAEALERR